MENDTAFDVIIRMNEPGKSKLSYSQQNLCINMNKQHV